MHEVWTSWSIPGPEKAQSHNQLPRPAKVQCTTEDVHALAWMCLPRQRGDAELATPPEQHLVAIAYNGIDHFDGAPID